MPLFDCTQPENLRCWEHHQGWSARVMTADIEQEIALLEIRVEQLHLKFSDDLLEKVEELVHSVRNLVSQQWREMTRPPFNFQTRVQKEAAQSAKAKVDLSAYDNLFGD